MSQELKIKLVNRLKQVGAYDVKVADPSVGFKYSVKGKHPLDLWQEVKSVVVFAIAMPPKTNNFFLGPYAPWMDDNRDFGYVPQAAKSSEYALDKLCRLFREAVKYKGMKFLYDEGYDVSFAKAQSKLCAYEAGLGVYGCNGLIIHPEIGNRICLEVILTNAVLPPDEKLQDFDPCAGCDQMCLKACPAKAFDLNKKYPESWDEKKCSDVRRKIEEDGRYCHNCFAACPFGSFSDEHLLCIKEVSSFYSREQ